MLHEGLVGRDEGWAAHALGGQGEAGGEGVGAEVDHHRAAGLGEGRHQQGVEEEDVEGDP